MKILVCAYKISGGINIPPPFDDIFKSFANGIKSQGDEAIVEYGPHFQLDSSIDAIVTWGTNKNTRRHRYMNSLRDNIIKAGKHVICIETPILDRKLISEHEYYRIGINHIVPVVGKFYLDKPYPSDRLNKIGITLKPWRKSGDHIVVITQNPSDQSLLGTDHFAWLNNVMFEIRKHTDRPITLKGHPNWRKNLNGRLAHITFKDHTFDIKCDDDRFDCLENCHAAVAFSSGMSLDCTIRGIPLITPEPYNFVYPISTNKISEIETPLLGDRESLLNKLAYAQWTISEMGNGSAWKHLRGLI